MKDTNEERPVSDSYNKLLKSLTEQDRLLPINNVSKLMKSVLPPSAKVSREAKECVQECVSEFISFVTSEASERCLVDSRKTVNGEDILRSLEDLGFENYTEVLKIYLAKYREFQILKTSMSTETAGEEHAVESLKQSNNDNNNTDTQIKPEPSPHTLGVKPDKESFHEQKQDNGNKDEPNQ